MSRSVLLAASRGPRSKSRSSLIRHYHRINRKSQDRRTNASGVIDQQPWWALLNGDFLAFTRVPRRRFLGAASEVLNPVPAVFLGGVQAGVGLIQQHFHFAFSIASRDGDSHTHGDEFLLGGTHHRCAGNDFAELIRAQQRIGQITVGQNQKKFFSAIAADTVVDAELRAQAHGDFAESLIAKKMAECVVHVLEMIDVAQDLPPACAPGELAPIPDQVWRGYPHDSSVR